MALNAGGTRMTLRINVKMDMKNAQNDLFFQVSHPETASVELLEEVVVTLESMLSGPEFVGVTPLSTAVVTI